jgi:hypothetical protein
MTTFVTETQFDEIIDDLATDDPLWALRHVADYLSGFRLDACATAEPEAALLYAEDLLTPERRATCEAAAPITRIARYFPDRIGQERLATLQRLRGAQA